MSSKNWGASTTLLNEIASETMDYEKFNIVMNIVWGSFDTDGKSWKQIFKSLTLLDFLIKNGSERIIEACRDKLYKIRSFQDYNFYEGTIDKGSGVRERAKQLVELLSSNEMIRSEREKARALRNKFVGIDSRNAGGGYGGSGSDYYGGSGGGGGGGGSSYGGSNGRYGGDSYSSSGGGGSRYGGGAYDSERPARYGDESTSKYDDNRGKDRDKDGYRDRDRDRDRERDRDRDTYSSSDAAGDGNERSSKAQSTTKPSTDKSSSSSSSSSTTATGGKLKVTIKKDTKAAAAPPPLPPSNPSDLNLLGDSEPDLLSVSAPVPVPVPANAPSTFDPFSPPAAVAAPAAVFDPFSHNGTASVYQQPPAPPSSAVPMAFDPFSAPAPITHPSAPQLYTATLQPQTQFNAFPPSPPPAFSQAQPQSFFQPAPAVSAFPMTQYATKSLPPSSSSSSPPPPAGGGGGDADFGDFEGPAQDKNRSAAAAATKWGDLGKLVDLSSIGKNEEMTKQKQSQVAASAAYAQSSFAGLDGFSKTPQSMSAARPAPLLSAPTAPRGPAMQPAPMAPQMGMGMMMMGGVPGGMVGPPSSQMGMMAPPQMGAGMGGGMGMQPAMGMGMGAGMGGYPAQGMYGGPPPMPMTMPMGGMGMGMGMGYPNQGPQPGPYGYPGQMPPQQQQQQQPPFRY